MGDNWRKDDFQKDMNNSDDKQENKQSGFTWQSIFNQDQKHASGDASRPKEANNEFGPESSRPRGKNVSQDRLKSFGPRFIAFILIAIILVILASGIYVVPEGKIAYITQFGKIVKQVEQAGLNYHLPMIQQANFLTSKIMLYDVSPSEVLTADKKAMIVDSYALWKIDNAQQFMRTVGGNVAEMEKRIDASVYSNIKNIVGELMQNEIISDEESSRDSLNQRVTKYAGAELDNYGVEVLRVEIRRYDLPVDNLSAVYNRMISERKQMAASFKADGEYEAAKLRNETDKEYEIMIGQAKADARRLQGEAEAEFMEILEGLYGTKDKAEFYQFMLELDALRASLQGDKTVILGPESVLGSMLRPENPVEK